MKIEESGIEFEFPEGNTTLKFDEDPYYKTYFNKMSGAKGVDFVSSGEKRLLFLEVKNCVGHENDNRWRIYPNNKKIKTSATKVETSGRESLDIEMAQKVAMSISNIVGANSFGEKRAASRYLVPLLKEITSDEFSKDRKIWYVILFLEGDFGCESRSKKMIMKDLQDSIKTKLSWLNCRVSVVDSNTYPDKLFRADAECMKNSGKKGI